MSYLPRRSLTPFKLIACLGLVCTLFASHAQAQLKFTVDEFSTEKLTITFLAGHNLSGSAINSNTILYITADSFNQDWILKDNAAMETVDSDGGSLGGFAFASGGAENHVLKGDYLYASFGNFTTGASFNSDLTLTMGHQFSGGFNPSAVDTLVLTWGQDGQSDGTQPWGVTQSTYSLAAVPEPQTTALGMGLLGLTFALIRRRRRASREA